MTTLRATAPLRLSPRHRSSSCPSHRFTHLVGSDANRFMGFEATITWESRQSCRRGALGAGYRDGGSASPAAIAGAFPITLSLSVVACWRSFPSLPQTGAQVDCKTVSTGARPGSRPEAARMDPGQRCHLRTSASGYRGRRCVTVPWTPFRIGSAERGAICLSRATGTTPGGRGAGRIHVSIWARYGPCRRHGDTRHLRKG